MGVNEMEENEIIEKIDKFFDKEGLDIQSKYFLTKKMKEKYWEEIQGEEEGDEDPLGELGAEETEPIDETEPEEEIAAPKPPKKRKITVKKPKVTAKKEEKEEEPLEEPEDVI